MYEKSLVRVKPRKRFFDDENYQIIYAKVNLRVGTFTEHFIFVATLFSAPSFPYNTNTLSFHYPRAAATKQHLFIFPNIIFYKQPRARLLFLNCSFRAAVAKDIRSRGYLPDVLVAAHINFLELTVGLVEILPHLDRYVLWEHREQQALLKSIRRLQSEIGFCCEMPKIYVCVCVCV